MFAEGQLTRIDWIDRLTGGQPISAMEPVVDFGTLQGIQPQLYLSRDRVPERNLGSFAGWPTMNDWYALEGPGIMHCCTGNAARTLYQAWERLVEHEDGNSAVIVNLLLNRASPWLDVDSHLPYKGQVDLRLKQDVDLSTRFPEWVDKAKVKATIRESGHPLRWEGPIARLGKVRGGSVVTLSFPISERVEDVIVEKQAYRLTMRGNDVVKIDPPGHNCPLYQREHFRSEKHTLAVNRAFRQLRGYSVVAAQ